MKTEREQLIDWLKLFSLETGEEFTLASGEKSNFYIDVKKTMLHHKVNNLLAKLLWEKMVNTFSQVEAVAGVVLGGCHLASIVSMYHPLGLDVILVRKEAKDHGTKKLIESPGMVVGSRIVLLEDVITTGKSAIDAAQLLEKEGFIVCGILAVVDRRKEKIPYLSGPRFVDYEFASLVKFEELCP